MEQIYSLTQAEAFNILNAVVESLNAEKKAAAVAIVDAHGELLAFMRTDGCRLAAINIAINKAFTSARERCESIKIGNASRSEAFPMTNYGDLRYTAWGGGVPLTYHGQVVGAIGVSGLTGEEDIRFASVGAKAILSQ
jgi:glc operon protein GlcG